MELNLRVALAVSCLHMLFILHRAICEIENKDGTPLSKFIHHFEPLNYDTTPLDVQQNTKQRSHSGRSSDDTISWEVSAFGRSFPLLLSPYTNVVGRGARLNIVSSEGISTVDMISHMYKGIVIGDKHSSAYGHIINGTFDGVIKTTGETFHIEPSFRFFSSPRPGFHSVIYRARDVHLQDYPDANSSASCQLCSVTWDGSNLPSSEKDSVSRHKFLNSEDKSSSSSGQRNLNSSRGTKPVAPSDSETYVDIFQTMQSSSNPNELHTSQDGSFDRRKSRASRDVEQSEENVNTSRREHLTDYDQTSKTCVLHIVVDHTFFQHVAGLDVTRAVAEVAYHIEEANSIYRATDFDGDGFADNVGLTIGGVTIFESATAQNYLLYGDYQDATEFLSVFSLYDFSAYCMGLAFTYRDFSGGILGLAWLGYPDLIGDPPGGICQKRLTYRNDGQSSSLNSAIITLVNYDTYVPRSISITSVIHELGHGFGSAHDPQTPHCSPSGLQGNYIMYSQATDGSRPNNLRFSSCSRSQMATVIASKGTLCLQSHTGQYCGNGLVENGEECDCGTASLCALADSCCTPRGGIGSDAECTLRRELGRVCSPLTSTCCDDDCHVVPASWHKHCFTDNECLEESFCNGSSVDCPRPESVPDGSLCEDGTKRCFIGQCTLSACHDLGLQECFCTDVNNTGRSCQLCCQVGDDCVAAAVLGLTTLGGDVIKKQPGSVCDNYTGYCDLRGFCVTIDTDSALDELKSVLAKEGADITLLYWMRTNWYFIVFGALCICFLSLSAKLSYDNRHRMRTAIRRASYFRANMERTGASSQTGAADSQSASVITPAATGNSSAEPVILTVETPTLASSPDETRV